MEIPNGMHRSEGERALFVVAAKQTGKLYYLAGSKLVEIAAVDVPTPRYSDREGQFVSRGNMGTYHTGAAYEPKDQESKKKFLKEITRKIKEVTEKRKIDAVYMFVPNYSVKELRDMLPSPAADKLRFTFLGNYVKLAPLELLRKIDEKLASLKDKSEPLNPAEAQILKRPKETTRTAKNSAGRK